jgi:histidine triad (HIT) family protein
MGQPDCLFCKLIEGQIPSAKVYETSTVYAFKDVSPQAKFHYLFVPKKHYESLADVPQGELSIMTDLYKAVRMVTDSEGLSEKGFRTVVNTKKEAGQTVFHLHLHVLGGQKLGRMC